MQKAGWRLEEGDEIAPSLYAIKRLGGGVRYEVYLAWDDNLFALVAAKMIRPDQTNDDRALHQIRREEEVLRRLNHPVVVRLFRAVNEGARPHLVLEHLEGPTLRSLLRKFGPLDLTQLLPLALNVAAVLHYLSQQGIVHMDVKPGNIVMGAPPRLIDFSLARTVDAAAKMTLPIGTDPYMAPEQCSPNPGTSIGFAADMWGLGATMYHSLTGRLAFSTGDRNLEGAGRFPQLAEDPFPLNENVDHAVANSIMRCLNRDPGGRPSPSEFALALQPSVEALPTRPILRRRRPKLR